MTVDARAVLALLANDDTRRVFALISLGQPVPTATKRDRLALQRLTDAGLLTGVPPVIDVVGLRAAIAEFSPTRPEGVNRFVHAGRIANYPSSDPDRIQLLEWVGRSILQPGERIGERELNERLHPLMHEHVLLRRYLVDYGVLDRSIDGSWYQLALGMEKAPDHE